MLKRRLLPLVCALALFASLAAMAAERIVLPENTAPVTWYAKALPDPPAQDSLLVGPAALAQFSDVSTSRWYTSAVQEVSSRGLMTGTSPVTFSPDAYVTRATVVTVLWRLEGCPQSDLSVTFADVKPGTWYEQAVAWAKANQIAQGFGANLFAPDDLVTREQLALFLSRYTYWKGEPLAEGFLTRYEDRRFVSPWAVDAMRHAVGAGLMTGTTPTTLSPLGYATRSQLAVTLDRLLTPVAG